GHTNTGLFNTGNVNTGAFNSGSFNNGALWTGDYHGLVGFSFSIDIAGSTLLDLNETLNLGPIHIEQIDIPGMSLFDVHEIVEIGPFTIPQVDVPAIPLEIHESIHMDPIVLVPATTIPAQTRTIPLDIPASPGSTMTLPLISMRFEGEDWILGSTAAIPNFGDPFPAPTQGITIHTGPGPGTTGELKISIPGFEIPQIATTRFLLDVNISGGLPAFTLFAGGLTIPTNAIPLTIDASGALDPITIFPGGYTIDPLPLHLALNLTVPDSSIPIIDVPPTPGFGNTTATPSSGFFNSGAGGVSGFGNVGSNLSGWWNQAASALAGSGSGVLNVGTLGSGVLNVGSGVSGIYNTSVLPLGTPA
ncbi:pentapeptide repeat-containing protein, partial [Mycobacterium tuberculosis]